MYDAKKPLTNVCASWNDRFRHEDDLIQFVLVLPLIAEGRLAISGSGNISFFEFQNVRAALNRAAFLFCWCSPRWKRQWP